MAGMYRHPRRLSCDDYRGHHQYFLTICAFKRQKHFVTTAVVDFVCRELAAASTKASFAVIAYCLMPDHLHAVVEGRSDDSNLLHFVGLLKQRTGYAFSRATGKSLWQDSYFDRTLRSDQSLASVVAYVIHNPIRAGLAVTTADYPYWGSCVYSREELLEFVAREHRPEG